MTTSLTKNTSDSSCRLNYSILVEAKEGGYQATVWGLPDCQAFAATREEAVLNLHELVNVRLHNVEIITQEMEVPKLEHPWMKFAGMYQDNPLFDEVVSNINAYRRELDTGMITED